LGLSAGCTNTIGSNNIVIGNGANVSTNSLSGVVVLGTGAIASNSNQWAMGSSTWPLSTASFATNGLVSSNTMPTTAAGFLVLNLNGTIRKLPFF